MRIFPRTNLIVHLLTLLVLCGVQRLSAQIIQTGSTPSLIFLQSTLLGHSDNVVHSTIFEYRNNTYLLTSSWDATAKLWSMSQLLAPGATPTTVATLRHRNYNHVAHSTAVEYRNNTYLLTSSDDDTAKLWSMSQLLEPNATPTAVATLEHRGNVVHSTTFEYQNDTYLLTSTEDNTAWLWSMSQLLAQVAQDATLTAVDTLSGDGDWVQHSIAFGYRDNIYLLISSDGDTAKLWSMSQLLATDATSIAAPILLKHNNNDWGIRHSTAFEYRNNTYLLTSSDDYTAKLWSMSQLLAPNATPTAVATLEHGHNVVHSTAFEYQNNTYLLTSSDDDTAKLWSMSQLLASGATPTAITLSHDDDVVRSTAFEYQGNTYLLTSSDDDTAKLWSMSQLLTPDATPSAIITLLHGGDVVHSTAFEYQGKTYLLTSSHDETAKLWWVTDDTEEVGLRISWLHYRSIEALSQLLTEHELQELNQTLTEHELQALNQPLTKHELQALNRTLSGQCNTEKQALNQSLRMQCDNELQVLSQEPASPHENDMTTLNRKLDKLIEQHYWPTWLKAVAIGGAAVVSSAVTAMVFAAGCINRKVRHNNKVKDKQDFRSPRPGDIRLDDPEIYSGLNHFAPGGPGGSGMTLHVEAPQLHTHTSISARNALSKSVVQNHYEMEELSPMRRDEAKDSTEGSFYRTLKPSQGNQ